MVLLDVLVPSTLAGFLIYMLIPKHMQWEVGISDYKVCFSSKLLLEMQQAYFNHVEPGAT